MQPKTLEPADPKLDAGHCRHAQSRARHAGPCGDVTNPALLFDRHTCFPIPTWQCFAPARNAGEGPVLASLAMLVRQGALRVAVIGGGCSGLQYKMDLVDGPANRDILVESNSVRVVVDPKSALFVSGSLLDYSEDLQKGGFKVTNPNAVAHCSCGERFSA